MAVEHLVDHERRLVEFVLHGAVSREEIEAFRRELEAIERRGPREYRVFRSLGEACAWLGLEKAGLCLEETVLG